MSERVSVPVTVDFNANGDMRPRQIIWEDGHVYDVERVINIQSSAEQKIRDQGDRYVVVIAGKRTNLFFVRSSTSRNFSRGNWYVERK